MRYAQTLRHHEQQSNRERDYVRVSKLKLSKGRLVVVATRWFTYAGQNLPGDPKFHHLL